MTAIILIVWLVCIASGIWHERVETRRAYRAILALARDGRCIRTDPDFICNCPGEATCGACWCVALGLDPDEWLEWCKVNNCTT